MEEKVVKNDDVIVSDDELGMCVNVLNCVWNSNSRKSGPLEGDFLLSARCKELRRSISKFSAWCESRKYEGSKSKEEYKLKMDARKQAKAMDARRKAMDRKHINSTKLRLTRIRKLKKLQEKRPDLPMIADGFVSNEDEEEVKLIGGDKTITATKIYNMRSCYVCKARFEKLHEFYDQLCPQCASINYQKRLQSCDFKGRVAIVTGGRVKIGFNVALKLLRWGGVVYVTTRFPVDALKRYRAQKDFCVWEDKLKIVGLDFRDIAGVNRFCNWFVETHKDLDALINNACQTIRRPVQYYAHLLEAETSSLLLKDKVLSDDGAWNNVSNTETTTVGDAASALASKSLRSYEKSQVVIVNADCNTTTNTKTTTTKTLFPENAMDVNMQQIDLRISNSWTKTIEDLETPEVAEVFAINSIAPFTLCSRLIPLLKRTSKLRKTDTFVVNVSAMEGKFYRHKLPTHPHTNAAKAALNMMTRTSAPELSKDGVLMTAVDTGWINDENPLFKAKTIAEKTNFQTPIDEIDAAARILDPIVSRVNHGTRLYGIFLKDYMECEW